MSKKKTVIGRKPSLGFFSSPTSLTNKEQEQLEYLVGLRDAAQSTAPTGFSDLKDFSTWGDVLDKISSSTPKDQSVLLNKYGLVGINVVHAMMHPKEKATLPEERGSWGSNSRSDQRFKQAITEYIYTGTSKNLLINKELEEAMTHHPGWQLVPGFAHTMGIGTAPAAKVHFDFGLVKDNKIMGFNFSARREQPRGEYVVGASLASRQRVASSIWLQEDGSGFTLPNAPDNLKLVGVGVFNPFSSAKDKLKAEGLVPVSSALQAVSRNKTYITDPGYSPVPNTAPAVRTARHGLQAKGQQVQKYFVLDFETTKKEGNPEVLSYALLEKTWDKAAGKYVTSAFHSRFYYPTEKDETKIAEALAINHLDRQNIARLRGDATYAENFTSKERTHLLSIIGNSPVLGHNINAFDWRIAQGKGVGPGLFSEHADMPAGGVWDLLHIAEAQRGRASKRNTLDALYRMCFGHDPEEDGYLHHDAAADVQITDAIFQHLYTSGVPTQMQTAVRALLGSYGSYTRDRDPMYEGIQSEIVLPNGEVPMGPTLSHKQEKKILEAIQKMSDTSPEEMQKKLTSESLGVPTEAFVEQTLNDIAEQSSVNAQKETLQRSREIAEYDKTLEQIRNDEANWGRSPSSGTSRRSSSSKETMFSNLASEIAIQRAAKFISKTPGIAVSLNRWAQQLQTSITKTTTPDGVNLSGKALRYNNVKDVKALEDIEGPINAAARAAVAQVNAYSLDPKAYEAKRAYRTEYAPYKPVVTTLRERYAAMSPAEQQALHQRGLARKRAADLAKTKAETEEANEWNKVAASIPEQRTSFNDYITAEDFDPYTESLKKKSKLLTIDAIKGVTEGYKENAALRIGEQERTQAAFLKRHPEIAKDIKDIEKTEFARDVPEVEKLSKAELKEIEEGTKARAKEIEGIKDSTLKLAGFAHVLSHATHLQPIYDMQRLYNIQAQGVQNVWDAGSDLWIGPAKYLQRPVSRWFDAGKQTFLSDTKRRTAAQNAATSLVTPILSGIGAVAGAVIGQPIAGAAIGAAGGQGISNIASWVMGKTEREEEARWNAATATMDVWSGAIQAFLIPLRMAADALKHFGKIAISVGSSLVRTVLSGLGLAAYNNPLTAMSGITRWQLERNKSTERALGIREGAINSMANQTAMAGFDLYRFGAYDQSKLLAAAMMGSFTEYFANDDNGQQHFENILNKAAKMSNKRDALGYVTKLYGEESGQILQNMWDFGVTRYSDLKGITGVFMNTPGKEEQLRLRKMSAGWKDATTQFGYTKQRAANVLWTGAAGTHTNIFGTIQTSEGVQGVNLKALVNWFNRGLDALVSGDTETAKNMASNIWKGLGAAINTVLPEIKEFAKNAWEDIKEAFAGADFTEWGAKLGKVIGTAVAVAWPPIQAAALKFVEILSNGLGALAEKAAEVIGKLSMTSFAIKRNKDGSFGLEVSTPEKALQTARSTWSAIPDGSRVEAADVPWKALGLQAPTAVGGHNIAMVLRGSNGSSWGLDYETGRWYQSTGNDEQPWSEIGDIATSTWLESIQNSLWEKGSAYKQTVKGVNFPSVVAYQYGGKDKDGKQQYEYLGSSGYSKLIAARIAQEKGRSKEGIANWVASSVGDVAHVDYGSEVGLPKGYAKALASDILYNTLGKNLEGLTIEKLRDMIEEAFTAALQSTGLSNVPKKMDEARDKAATNPTTSTAPSASAAPIWLNNLFNGVVLGLEGQRTN